MNICSLWKKLDSIKIALDSQFDIDVLGLSETWLTQSLIDSLVNIKNYELLRLDRNWCDVNNNTVKRGGGTCLFISNKLKFTTHDVQPYNISCQNIECQWVKIILQKKRNVIIGNLYRPPQGNVQQCIDYLEGVLENMDLSKEDVFIMGDFNIDFSEKSNDATKSINEFCTQNGLDTCIKTATRFSRNKNSCIDQILTNSNFVAHSGTQDFNTSDHQLIYIIRKKKKK